MGLEAREQLVEVPAKTVHDASALAHEILAMVDQESKLTRLAVQASDGEIGLAERDTRDGEGIDGVGLAALATALTGTGHEVRRHPHDRFASPEQVELETSGQVAAVLEREPPLRQRPAQAIASRWPSGVAATVLSASLRPVSSAATRVWLRLWASTPMITTIWTSRCSILRRG